MKKQRGTKRAVEIVSRQQLENMPTKALLARLQRLRWCEENADRSDLTNDEIGSLKGMIIFKNTSFWRDAYNDVKTVLDEREHISK